MKYSWMAILATCTLISFANASNTNSKYYEISLQQIIENNADCVREICSNKIYLKTDSIFISEKGVYMMLNDFDDYAYLPELCTDADGYFIRVILNLMLTKQEITKENALNVEGDIIHLVKIQIVRKIKDNGSLKIIERCLSCDSQQFNNFIRSY